MLKHMAKIISEESHNRIYTVRVSADSLIEAELHVDYCYSDCYHEALLLSSVSIVNLPDIYEIKFRIIRPG